MNRDPASRRRVLRATGRLAAIGGAGVFAGCLDGGGGGGSDVPGASVTVQVDPEANNRFVPDAVTVAVGETVGWNFVTAGHNVSARPDHSKEVSIPDGAEPFASYAGDNKFQTASTEEHFTHTFGTPGEYRYVCIPHVSLGMIGTVTVE